MKKSQGIDYAKDKGGIPAGGERPEIKRMGPEAPTTDIKIERATGTGTTETASMPLLNADQNLTRVLKP